VLVLIPNIPFILIIAAMAIITDIKQNGIKFEYEHKTTDLVPEIIQHVWAGLVYMLVIVHFV
jgi:hypothetical protein